MKRRGMSKVLAFTVSLAIITSNMSVFAKETSAGALQEKDSKVQWTEEDLKKQLYDGKEKLEDKIKDPEATVRVIVETTGESAMARSVETPTPFSIQVAKNNIESVKQKVTDLEGAKIRHTYGVTFNGFSMDIKAKDIDKLKDMYGVKNVSLANVYETDMTNAKKLTQVYDEWKDYGFKGEGQLVSIIDTGIDYDHKDMKDPTDKSKLKLTADDVYEIIDNYDLEAEKGHTFQNGYYTDKVPFGHNYADADVASVTEDIVKDTKPDGGHGMHVAGIVGANGDEEEVKAGKAIQGVAPETQLLAMKVFSNDANIKGAYSDDIIAAIEDSIVLGADVINMSLGAPSGFQDSTDPEQQAVKHATDAGIIVVISAGNSSTSTYPYVDPLVKDTSTTGTPGLAADSLMVANYQNTMIGANAINLKVPGKEDQKFPFKTHQVKFTKNELKDFVNGGVGKPEQLKDVKGKIAVVERGELAFTDKILNAQKQGAIGVVVYNHTAGGDEMINMATDPNIKIPAIFTSHKAGVALISAIPDKPTLVLNDGTVEIPNPASGDYDDSTSWGPSPNLDFKPQIAAPGGNITSTINNNQYDVYSGTSMAAPHVAGAMAVIKEEIKNSSSSFNFRNPRALVEYAKNCAMNTSDVKIDGNSVPYSPRRQGSGLIQLNNAVKNRVTATYKGEANVALKEIGKEGKTFTIKLQNYGSTDVRYDLSLLQGVLTDGDSEFGQGMCSDIVLPASKANVTFGTKTIVVPAGQSAEFNATLRIGNLAPERFLEGYIKLTSKTDGAPDLNVPFMGYYGEWDKAPILSNFIWDEEPNNVLYNEADLQSRYAYGMNGKYYYASNKPEELAFSPNNDGDMDSLIPLIYFMRNAKTFGVEIEDKDGENLGEIVNKSDYRRQIFNDNDGSGKDIFLWPELAWDGKIKGQVAAEGQYTVVLKPVVGIDGAKPQEYRIPMKLDLTKPELNITSSSATNSNEYEVAWTVTDNLSGIEVEGIFLNGKLIKDAEIKVNGDNRTAKITLPEGKDDATIEVMSIDRAHNVASSTLVVKRDNTAPVITVTGIENGGLYNKDVAAEVSINEEGTLELTLDGNPYKNGTTVNVEGTHVLKAVAKDLVGNITTETYTFTIDKTAPEISIQGIEDKGSYNKDVAAKVMTNEEATLELTLNGKPYVNEASISDEGQYVLKAVATDKAGNKSEKSFEFAIDKANPEIKVEGLNDGWIYNKDITPVITFGEDVNAEITLNGKPYVSGTAISSEGNYELKIVATDKAGNKNTVTYKFVIDKTPAVVKITGVEDGGHYNKDVTVGLSVNEKAETSVLLNGKPYDLGNPITEEGNYELEITAIDAAKNSTKVVVKFVIDKTAPEVIVKGVEDGKYYNAEVKPEITSNEDAVITATLNGKEYKPGTAISDEGEYELKIFAVDKANNKSEEVIVKFTIDKTAPEVKISGIEDGNIYDKAVKIEVETEKDSIIKATLNGKDFDLTKEIIENGEYTLVLKVQDKAGNVTEKTMKFTVAIKGNNPGGNNGNTNKPSNDKPATGIGKLPQTGAPISFADIMTFGFTMTMAGTAFLSEQRRRNRKNQNDDLK